MKICLFGAASSRIDEKYVLAVERLGEEIARRGHTLVFGGGKGGLMGAAARGIHRCGGTVTGVVPEFFKGGELEALYTGCDELIYTPTIAERKALMEELADAFVVVPGGIGTLEEFLEILTLRQLRQLFMPIAQLNAKGYFDPLNAVFENAMKEGFIREDIREFFRPFPEPKALLDYLEQAAG